MSLRMNVHMLTRPHISRDDQGRLGTAQPLLVQLTSTASTNGRSTGSEPPLPVSVKAMSLYVQMEWDARNEQYVRTGDDSGGLWQIVSSWESVEDPEWEPYLERVTEDWIARIVNTIDPPRPRRPLRQDCAACGQRWVYDQDGHRSEAVTAWVWDENGAVGPVEAWDVTCTACGAQWIGREVATNYWRAVGRDAA